MRRRWLLATLLMTAMSSAANAEGPEDCNLSDTDPEPAIAPTATGPSWIEQHDTAMTTMRTLVSTLVTAGRLKLGMLKADVVAARAGRMVSAYDRIDPLLGDVLITDLGRTALWKSIGYQRLVRDLWCSSPGRVRAVAVKLRRAALMLAAGNPASTIVFLPSYFTGDPATDTWSATVGLVDSSDESANDALKKLQASDGKDLGAPATPVPKDVTVPFNRLEWAYSLDAIESLAAVVGMGGGRWRRMTRRR